MKQPRSVRSLNKSVAICRAGGVFPPPPGPVRVTRRTSGRSRRAYAAATSCSRPIKDVSGAGTLRVNVYSGVVGFLERRTSTLSCIADCSQAPSLSSESLLYLPGIHLLHLCFILYILEDRMFFALTGVCILHAPYYYIHEHTTQGTCFTKVMLSVCSSGSVSLRKQDKLLITLPLLSMRLHLHFHCHYHEMPA